MKRKLTTKLDVELSRLQTRVQKSETLFNLTEANHDYNVPIVANKIGHQATEVVDDLYEKQKKFNQRALRYLDEEDDLARLSKSTGLPKDFMTVLRLAEQKSWRPKQERHDSVTETPEQRLAALMKFCELNNIKKPDLTLSSSQG